MTDFERYIQENLTDHPTGLVSDACPSYLPGHKTHFIQARLSWEDSERAPAELIAVDGNWITFESAGIVYTQWTHDRECIADLLNKVLNGVDAKLLHSARYHLLTGYSTEPSGFCTGRPLCLADEPSDCNAEPPSEIKKFMDVFTQAQTHGGGFMSAGDFRELLGENEN